MNLHMYLAGLLPSTILAVFTVGVLVGSCGTDPHPPTSSACFDDPDVRLSCSTCASTPVCAWCASPDAQRRGCYPRAEPFDCDGEVVRISDICSDLSDGLHRAPESP